LDSRHASADMDVIKVIFHKLEHCGCQRLIFHHMLYLNINIFANDFRDLGTSDYVTGLMETHEKMAWMLRSHLR
jgi:hypothetical protein